MEPFSKKNYKNKVEAIFTRFPSVQKVPFKDAYKPGLENMLRFEEILGNPHESLRTIHVAGTNGKGSVANMLASALSACGLKVGLYTSPHIVDFRERMRIAAPAQESADPVAEPGETYRPTKTASTLPRPKDGLPEPAAGVRGICLRFPLPVRGGHGCPWPFVLRDHDRDGLQMVRRSESGCGRDRGRSRRPP